MDQKPDFKRPKASSIGTPVYHRKRRDWKDDRNLLEDVASAVCLMNGPYDYYEAGTVSFRNKIKKFREKGYEVNKDACHLAMWVREQLSELSHKLGNYDGSEIISYAKASLSCSQGSAWSNWVNQRPLTQCSLTAGKLTTTSTRNNMPPYAAVTYIIKT